MEKNRGTAIAVIVALVVSVISLGVAFATFSTTLNINGSATVQASSWDVHFTTDSTNKTAGGTVANPTINGTATSTEKTLTATDFTWEGTLKSPGDSIQYHFYVTNQGSYNAKISSVSPTTVSCKIGQDTENTYCPYIDYKVSYDADGNNEVSQNDTLVAGGIADIYVTITLTDYTTGNNAINTPPSSAIDVTANPIQITYVQDGSAVSGH